MLPIRPASSDTAPAPRAQAWHHGHQTLDELMDPDVADTLMRHLPPGGWANMATKHDLTELEGRLTNRFETLLAREIGSLRSEMHTELHAMARTYLLGNIALVFTVAAIAFGAARLV